MQNQTTALTISDERAQELGDELAVAQNRLAVVRQMELRGNRASATFTRAAAVLSIRAIMSTREASIVSIMCAREGFVELVPAKRGEVVRDSIIVAGCAEAVLKGAHLFDDRGPQFAIVAARDGSHTVMMKEPWYRDRLKELGARQVDVVSAMLRMEPRPNDMDRNDAVLCGYASCTMPDGSTVRIERMPEFPFRLPCWPSDGPDSHEAKAARRLLKMLWNKVLGEDVNWQADDAIEQEQEEMQAIEHVAGMMDEPEEPANEMDPAKLFDMDVDSLRKIAAKMPDKSEREALADIVKAITAADAETLQANAADWMEAAKMHSRTVQGLVSNLIEHKRAMLDK